VAVALTINSPDMNKKRISAVFEYLN
jgi:hypothetical protein